MIFGKDKKMAEFHRSPEKGRVLKRSEVTTQRTTEMEVGFLLLGNYKSNVIANKVLSYF